MWITTILVGALFALIVKWWFDRIQTHNRFTKMCIPGPEPQLLYGNFMEIAKKGFRVKLLEWHKKYGKTFGYYEGDVPVLATSDLDILKKVLIKEFSSFHSRKPQKIGSSDDSIINSEGENWKRQRMILSPTFSTRGIREMSTLVNDKVTKLMELFEKRAEVGKAFDVTADFQKLTISSIACCGFGLDVDAINNPEDIFLTKCTDILQFNPPVFTRAIVHLSFIFPSIYPVFKRLFPQMFARVADWFYATAKAIIESRRGQKSSRKDFIQLMLQAEELEQPKDLASLEVNVDDDVQETEKVVKPTESKTKNRTMSLKEMQASCVTFLLAGFETTSTTLSFLAYELALHPEIQDKLQKEVDEHFPDDEAKHYDYLSVQKLPYMEMVFAENLRLHPPAQIVQTRRCFTDCSINGIDLKAGDEVQVLIDVIHHDPELWGPEDTSQFVPDRFLPERKNKRDSMAWMPFGGGPRNCIGMRFAIMEVKLAMIRLLQKFRIVRCEDTQVPVRVDAHFLARPLDGIKIKLENRQ